MQLKIQRSQRTGGIAGNTVFFCLDVRADYSAEEQDNIRKYNMGGQGIYNSRAAERHLDNASAQLERTQSGTLGERFTGLAKGALSTAMARMALNITIASLGRGHHIECKDLEELLESEDTVRTSCKNVTRFLQVAETFNGGETVIEYVNGEEQIHIAEAAPPLLTYEAPAPAEPIASTNAYIYDPQEDAAEQGTGKFWDDPQYRILVFAGGGIILLIVLLRSFS